MKPLFDINEKLIREKEYPFECEQCLITFYEKGKWIKMNLKKEKLDKKKYLRFCTPACHGQFRTNTILIKTICAQCNYPVTISPSQKNKF